MGLVYFPLKKKFFLFPSQMSLPKFMKEVKTANKRGKKSALLQKAVTVAEQNWFSIEET